MSNNLKEQLKQRSPLRQEIKQVDALKSEIKQPDRPPFAEEKEDRPTVNLEIEVKPKRKSVRVSYQFYIDQHDKLLYIKDQYNKRRKKERKKPLPISFFSKRAYDEYIARCMTKIEEWGDGEERKQRDTTDRK